ncbi:PadR family transcriptional regulator [Mangrovicella endophytica]|uniref:PadR family transcriptional regulator n=1 Tax=Mangrovicella endophytica TaxID=2066697 RepID=UPI001FE05696|nr:PadR family transcriptional regulator [Mangrovicella endophytica]
MRHRFDGGWGRAFTLPETHDHRDDPRMRGAGRGFRGPHHRPGGDGPGHGSHDERRGRGRGGRLFDYGDLRLLLLAMLEEQPCHGYELIKAIEERFAGSYSPSPGVVYPTLSWLEDMGYASVEPEPGNRKRYVVTEEGKAFLAANRAAADELLARGAGDEDGPRHGRHGVPAPVLRAMENLKLALRLRLREGNLEPAAAEAIAAALDAAAQAVERSR